ncbi:MAG: twin-arginine translocase subunit TatC, partial [Oscillospiraceae bacterium]|nr:twin-arginine translocase subunit TatC [Oscillospiraceae bacterium]
MSSPNNIIKGVRKRLISKSEQDERSMSVVGHLTELKNRIVCILIVFVFAVAVCYFVVDKVMELFLDMGELFDFIYVSPSELVMTYFRIVIIGGIVITIPVICYHIWAFFSPALSKKEKCVGLLTFTGGLFFFSLGSIFAYKIVLPFMLNFFATYNPTEKISAAISIENYISFMLSTVVVFGVIFEMPMATLLLTSLNIVNMSFLKRLRKIAILI